jgi:PAS domain S-box-containing protein
MILLLIVAVAGWFATDYLGNKAWQEIIKENHASVLTLSTYVSSTLTKFEGAVESLSGSPSIAPALMSKTDQDIENVNSTIDRYNKALNASVTYLMAADGMTVASSNRMDPDSFVGKSYRFRPYFQEATKGQPGRYFALGITSAKRGFYASYPVQNHLGEVMGVVTMKKDIDEIETFFSRYPFCFLISPDGIIFLSGTPAMVTRSLWPIDKAVRETLVASRQFGNNLSEPLIKKEIADGTEVALEGKDYFVSRKVIDSDGWSIVLMTPTDRIMFDRLISILATIFVSFLIIVFSGIIYDADRSKEKIRQSEESKRLLLLAVGEGIFGVDSRGRVTFINPAALRMLGYAQDEMLGQSVHDHIHHSHEDGSKHPVEDCPIYDSYTHAAISHVMDGVFWRKDGSSFPVEYSSMPIIQDGQVMGSVVNFTDITERKRIEEALRESEEKFRLTYSSSPDAVNINRLDDGLYVDVNEGFTRATGYTREEVIGRPSLELNIWHDPADRQKLVQGLQEKGYYENLEAQFQRKDGSLITALMSARVISLKGVSHIISLTRDITDRKIVENALLESRRRLSDVIEFLPDATLAIDREKRIIIWNREIEKMTGVPAAEMIGKGDYAYTIPFYGEARPQLMDLIFMDNKKNSHEPE